MPALGHKMRALLLLSTEDGVALALEHSGKSSSNFRFRLPSFLPSFIKESIAQLICLDAKLFTENGNIVTM